MVVSVTAAAYTVLPGIPILFSTPTVVNKVLVSFHSPRNTGRWILQPLMLQKRELQVLLA